MAIQSKECMPKNRLPALANSAVWEKVTKGTRWGNVVDKVERNRRKPRRGTAVHGEVWGVQDSSKGKDRKTGKASVKQGGRGKTFGDMREDKITNRN